MNLFISDDLEEIKEFMVESILDDSGTYINIKKSNPFVACIQLHKNNKYKIVCNENPKMCFIEECGCKKLCEKYTLEYMRQKKLKRILN